MQVFNWSLFAKTVCVVTVLIPAAYGWHAFQVNRTAATYRLLAERFESDQQWEKASEYWTRYVRLQPRDGEARIRLALAFKHQPLTGERLQQATELYSVAIGIDPQRIDLHRDLADILLRITNLSAAADRASAGLLLEPKDAACLKSRALALHGQARLTDKIGMQDVIAAFAAALAAAPDDIDLTATAARFYREDERELPKERAYSQADELIDRLVAAEPDDPVRLIARYEYRTKYDLPDADRDLDRALKVAPKNVTALYYAGLRDFNRREYLAAERKFQEAIAADDRDHRGYLGLAKSQSAQGNRPAAAETLRLGIRFVGNADLPLRSDWAALLTSLNRLDEARELINSVEHTAAFYAPLLNAAERIELQNGVRLLRCQWMMSAGDHQNAILQLRGLLTTPIGARAEGALQHTQGYVMLGSCHAALNQWDLAAGAYEQASRIQPLSASIRFQQAEALEHAGQYERAIRTYQTALRMPDVPHTAKTSLARCRLRFQLCKPDAERDWTLFEAELVEAQQSQTDAVGVTFLLANFAHAQARTDDAVAIMRKAELELAEVTDAWAAIAVTYEQWNMHADADRAWMRYRQLKGPSADEVLLRCELLCRRRDFDEARDYVRNRIEKLDGEERRRARVTLAFLELQSGNSAAGTELLERLSQESPQDVDCLQALGDVYLDRRDFARVRAIETALAAAEGVDGCCWRELECRRLFETPGTRKSADVNRITRLQAEMETLRPSWPRGYLVKGMLADLQKNVPVAIAAYEQALQLGDRRHEVYYRLIPLLFAVNRLADAQRYLSMLGPAAVVDLRTTLQSISANLRNGQSTRAVEIARSMHRENPENPMSSVMLGQTLWTTGQADEAERVLNEAVTNFGGDPRTWMALFGLHLRRGHRAEAEQVLDELSKHKSLRPEQRAFLSAQGNEMLGRDEQAKRRYLEARSLAPDDLTIQQTCGLYLMRRSPAEAEQSLRRVLTAKPDAGSARRALASILAARGGEKAWQEAWSLLQHENHAEESSIDDERLRAVLLVHRGTPDNRRRALEIMERLTLGVAQPLAGDRLLLTKLYDDAGRIREADAQLALLTAPPDCDLGHLAFLADFLLRHKRLTEVPGVLKRLESRAPENFACLSLRARWFSASGNQVEIRPLIEGFVAKELGKTDDVDHHGQVLLEAANLYLTLQMQADAERLYRKLYAASPRDYRFLARYLVLCNRTTEAVTLCLEAAQSQDLVSTAALLCTVLARGQAAPHDHARAEPVVAAALQAQRGDVPFLFSLATLRYFQQRKEDALDLYLKVLETFPDHVSVLNNVANLLSEIPTRRREAVDYINRALAVQGPHADLLDTLGIVLLRNGDAYNAIKALEQACASPTPDARYYFHLALAYLKNGQTADARKTIERADQLGFDDLSLTAEERLSLSGLRRQLAERRQ